jgi:hypothetical protein
VAVQRGVMVVMMHVITIMPGRFYGRYLEPG